MNYEGYRKEKMQALKDKDKMKNRVLTNLLSALTYATKELGRDLSDAECDQVLSKELKKVEESLTLSEGRPDIQEDLIRERDILRSYMPAQLDDASLAGQVEKSAMDAGLERTMKSKGELMRLVLAKVGSQADGKRVSEAVDTYLRG